MSVQDYDSAVSAQLLSEVRRVGVMPTQNDGTQLSIMDITEKKRPSGDRPIVMPTSSVAQARTADNDFNVHALLVRRKLDKDGESEGTQLEIQSTVIQNALRSAMPECAYLNLAAHPVIINAPYWELYQYRHEIHEYATDPERTDNEKLHLALLLRFMSANLAKISKLHSQFSPHWTSTYDILWTYFRAETFVVYQCENYQELYRVRQCEYREDPESKEKYFELGVWSWDYNGAAFGPATKTLLLREFQGVRSLREIEVFPLESLSEEEKSRLIPQLIERGKKWRRLVSRAYQEYSGPGWVASDPTKERRGQVTEKTSDLVPVHISGRVMVDYENHKQRNYMLATKLYTRGDPVSLKPSTRQESNPNIAFFSPQQRSLLRDKVLLNKVVAYADTDEYDISDFQAALVPARARGFSFVEKRWAFFLVDHLKDVSWMERKFNELELKPGSKEMIQALVSERQAKEPRPNQLSKKGRGLVILLYGPPGTGKTLTAEAISELTHRPLYYVGVNELMSSYFDDSETTMRRVFDLATSWGAIILLDEADVFLATRDSADGFRSGLVATFLRVLEYHEGIVFLTTNRLEDFDDAFESRLHLRLRFSALTAAQRSCIWKTALSGIPEAQKWPAEDVQRIAESLDVNGRQIANLARTALAFSTYKREPLTVETLMLVHNMSTAQPQQASVPLDQVATAQT